MLLYTVGTLYIQMPNINGNCTGCTGFLALSMGHRHSSTHRLIHGVYIIDIIYVYELTNRTTCFFVVVTLKQTPTSLEGVTMFYFIFFLTARHYCSKTESDSQTVELKQTKILIFDLKEYLFFHLFR